MRKFGIVLKYELKEYFNSKGFMALTFVIAFLGAALLFLPRFIDMSDFTGVQVVGEKEEPEEVSEEDMTQFAYIDLTEEGILQEELLRQMFPGINWHRMNSIEELKQGVEGDYDAGFAVTSPTEYDYYVFNKSMTDSNTAMFDEIMRYLYRLNYCAANGLDLTEIAEMYNVPITVNEQILNKDSGSNYWYCYVLVIIVFMLIIYYGQMIAVSVTNEKSNRAIEVLVTSTTSNSLLFGKVIAGAIVPDGLYTGCGSGVLQRQSGTVGRYAGYVPSHSGRGIVSFHLLRAWRISVLCFSLRCNGGAGQQDRGYQQDGQRSDACDYGGIFLLSDAADECRRSDYQGTVLPAIQLL